MTRFTRLFHNASRAFAVRAHLRDAKNAARHQNLSASAASVARLDARTFFRAAAAASVALVQFADGNFFLAAARGFFERDFQIVTQVVAALRTHRVAPAAE